MFKVIFKYKRTMINIYMIGITKPRMWKSWLYSVIVTYIVDQFFQNMGPSVLYTISCQSDVIIHASLAHLHNWVILIWLITSIFLINIHIITLYSIVFSHGLKILDYWKYIMIIQFTFQYIKSRVNISAPYNKNSSHWSSWWYFCMLGKIFHWQALSSGLLKMTMRQLV